MENLVEMFHRSMSATIARKPLCYIKKALEQDSRPNNFGYKTKIVHAAIQTP